MEQIYLVEIFIDKVTIFASEQDEESAAKKSLIIKIRFGPKAEFIVKEGQLAINEDTKDDIIECDDLGRRKWTRTVRVGKSYLFPSYPDTLLMILSKFPLEIEVWNDDENEVEIFVGLGTMLWDTQFFRMLKETADTCKVHEPLTIKQVTPLYAECCCKQCGEISFILRLSALGESIITEYQQLLKDPDQFVFRTNKAPSMFQCHRIEGDDPNFCMVGSLYETTTLEDPTFSQNAQQKIEICTELQSCAVAQNDTDYKCVHDSERKEKQKKYPINKIRMGDITGPCGNTNCPLAHKVKTYLRNLESYKRQAEGKEFENKGEDKPRKVCGTCDCKDDRWHREECPEKQVKAGKQGTVVCSGCGGTSQAGETCEDRKQKHFGTGATPKSSPTKIAYVFNVTEVPNFLNSMFGSQSITNYNIHTVDQHITKTGCSCSRNTSGGSPRINVLLPEIPTELNYNGDQNISKPGCSCTRYANDVSPSNNAILPEILSEVNQKSIITKKAFSNPNFTNNTFVYNVNVNSSTNKNSIMYNCNLPTDDKECKCNPPKPAPLCKTFDCDCIQEIGNMAARKAHKPFCPLYKHKSNCPVTMMHEDESTKKAEDEEEEIEALPYGLPPIQLGPCPVLGRPCAVPDGFARMYKNAALPAQPPSHSDAGKVCCSKEYERIKKAIKDYMRHEKDDDFRCINKFNVDTETRCCDKEQRLFALMGKACCGSHKLSIQDKFKDDKNKNKN